MKFLSVAVLSLVIGNAYAASCSLSPEAAKGAINKKSGTIVKFSSKKKSDNRKGHFITEKATMGDGWKVTYTAGGCEHIAQSYTFEKLPEEVDTDEKDKVLAFAAEMLGYVPVVAGDTSKETLLKAIEDAKSSDADIQDGILILPCGDANCSIDASYEDKFTIQYDFAL